MPCKTFILGHRLKSMLETNALSYSYDNSEWIDFPDIQCAADTSHLILGQSGTGKTTFLHLIGGLLESKKGNIIVNGTDITKLKGQELDKFRGDNIGIVFQQAHFINAISVKENLMIAQRLAGKPIKEKDIHDILGTLNIEHKANNYPKHLSQGEKQRVVIARALINKPAVILADEPTSALDDHNCVEVIKLLEHTAKEVDAALIIVTHDNRLMDYFPNQIKLHEPV